MNGCKIENCLKKHHAKGLCSFHYRIIILKESKEKLICNIEGCNRVVSIESGKLNYCCTHFFRLKRNGDPHTLRNIRIKYEWDSLSLEDKLFFVFQERFILVKRAYEHFNNECMICGWNKAKCDVHHVIPVSEGGKHSLNNIMIVCPNCHREIHEKLASNKPKLPRNRKRNLTKIKLNNF